MAALEVAVDAGMLLAALACPGGTCQRLLHLAALGVWRPVVSAPVLDEAEGLARAGVAGHAVADAEWLAFRMAIAEFIRSDAERPAFASPAEPALAAVLAGARQHGCQLACIGRAEPYEADHVADGVRLLAPAQLLETLLG